MLKQEWLSIWKDKKYMLSIVVMFIMPVLYCGLLLSAFWNPYGQLEDLPVALINEDKGSTFEDESLALGDELVQKLTENPAFKFVEVSRSEAEERLASGDVYLTITIPENFSEHATTMLDSNPEKLEIEYKVNEATNYLSSKIGESAINQIRTEVNEEISKTYAEQLFTAISHLSDGFGDAADGAVEIKDGVVELKTGTMDLKEYLQQLASSTVTLKDGTHALASGVSTVKDGAEQLVEGTEKLKDGSEQLVTGVNDLQQGVNRLALGVESYTAGVDEIANNQAQILAGQQSFHSKLGEAANASEQLATGAATVAAGSEQLASGIAQLNTNLSNVLSSLPEQQKSALQATLTQLVESSQQLAAGARTVHEGTTNLTEGNKQLVEGHASIVENSEKLAVGMSKVTSSSEQLVIGANQLETGFTTLSNKVSEFNEGVASVAGGMKSLDSGLEDITSGTVELASGTKLLSEKSGELADGSSKLVQGSEQLIDGAEKLVTALSDANADSTVDASNQNFEMVASPVQVNKEVENKVDNYGTGLAPYFISLGLFVGALLLTNVYSFVTPSIRPTGLLRWFISKCSVPFVVWIFQSAVLIIALLYGLKLNVTNLPLFIMLIAIISFAFIAIVQLLVVLMGDVGKFIALVFLIVQLSASAGTFPVELLPKVFQSLYAYMPMTYSIQALRHVISSTDYSVVYTNMSILTVIGLCCFALTFAYFFILYKLRYSKPVEA